MQAVRPASRKRAAEEQASVEEEAEETQQTREEASDDAPAHDQEHQVTNADLNALRANYRALYAEAEQNKEDWSRPNDPTLLATLKKQDKLFADGALRMIRLHSLRKYLARSSKRTAVAVLDAELLRQGAEIAVTKANRIQTTFQAQEPIELIQKLNQTYNNNVRSSNATSAPTSTQN